MISSDVMRGYNELMIVSLLMEEDSYGYEISKRIREICSEKYVMKETTLYSAFTRLEKAGYIESYFGTETNGKKRTYYKITSAGQEFYREKCAEWQLVKEVVEKFVKE
ncbi:MAG: PadR family transcriptional regulator [Clostridiales bacterium]|nr:PadR family transcriptional regulator [Clostridiales bacterium]